MRGTSPDRSSLAKQESGNHHGGDQRPSVARAALAAGGGFAAAIATVLSVAGQWALDDNVIVFALAGVCVVVAATLLLVAYLMR